MITVENLHACTGCRLCELACSFHHAGAFGRGQSSIRVRRYLDTGRVDIAIDPPDGPERPPCDGCAGYAVPLCLSYCPENVLANPRSAS